MDHEIRIFDGIGGYGITAEDIAAGIPDGTERITVRINSPGGAVSDGIAIYNYLRDHSAHITTVVDGYAASAASLVMLAGDTRNVHSSSIVMIHNPWGMTAGDADEMRHTADVLDEHTEALLDIYEARTGMERDELAEMLNGETWMRGAAAVENGFADVVIDDESDDEMEKAAASVSFARLFAVINEGTEIMSKQKTRKEIEADLETVNGYLAVSQDKVVGQSARIDDLVAEAAASAIAHGDALADLNAQIVEKDATIKAAQEAQLNTENERDALTERVTTLTDLVADQEGDMETMRGALADPTLADAALAEFSEDVPGSQADAEADVAEAAASVDVEDIPIWDQYALITDSGERRAFYLAHKAELIEASKQA
jgi:ATP-dependent Clp endopeptidase proteolytic subunit ClpP